MDSRDPFDRYGTDVLAGDWRGKNKKVARSVAAERDLVVEESASGWVGAVVRVDARMVELEDRRGLVRAFPLGGGFLIDGEPVVLTAAVAAPTGPKRTASGSFAVENLTARTARASRIYVEGRHDAELVEKVWGHDLRVEGVVVEFLGGVDDLASHLDEVAPNRGRRIGVLVDHLVEGSKESRIAAQAVKPAYRDHVLIVGHPFIDVWQAVKPSSLGIRAWPTIPRGIEWKKGICQAFGWPHETQADIARAWQRILSRVNGFGDLEPELLGRVEQLIDFVTEPTA
ncbi:DUF3097 domain-containing protein [Labedella populi]|uniref:DUF3097 domain-containing protein n=1 Tax=Labedella populi TaxID=2498850 RepID=A0A3S4EDF1_9MICO|nr:DUF3097 domain-containing protein [Labedella populi]RWZ68788.1 DUF3097 domain-containing protein [Labedella populi]